MKRKLLALVAISAFAFAKTASAEGWCDLLPGWTVITHGNRADNVFIQGQLQGASGGIWMQISSATLGKANVAVALAAQLAGRNLSIYLDSPSATCATFPSWAPMGEIRHVQVRN